MTKEQLFDAIGGVEENYIRDAGEEKRRKSPWAKWAALAACLVLVVGVVLALELSEKMPAQAGPASLEYNGVKYLQSGSERYSTVLSELPEGYSFAGTMMYGEQGERSFYTNPEESLWVYVYCTVYSNNSYQPPKMAYVRFVDARLRNAEMICYEGRLYIGMMTTNIWHSEEADVEQALYDALEAEFDLAFEGAAPEGFVCLGEVEYTGPDTIPDGALAGNIKAVVWAHPDRPELLLKETYSYTYKEPENWSNTMRDLKYLPFTPDRWRKNEYFTERGGAVTKDQMFTLIGEAEENYIRDAGEEKKRKSPWAKWAALAACLVLVVGAVLWQMLPQEKVPGDRLPLLEWEGNTFIVSGHASARETQLPEGWVLAGTAEIDGEVREVYTHPDEPLWVYVRQPWYSSEGKPSGMIYQRYVDAKLRGNHFVRCNGQLYIRLIHGRMPPYEAVDSELCDRIERTYGVSVTALPEGFAAVGAPVFTGDDTLPMVERGTNEPVEAIYANPDVPEILLTPTGNGYLVMIPYIGPLA